MARAARPWFRFYVEAFNDRKLLRLTPTQRWVWVAILGAARESHVPGELWIAEGVPMTHGEIAHYAGVKEREIAPALGAMSDLGMVSVNGVVAVTNWSHRQYESDDVTARTAKHRSKERSNDVPGNAPDTETDTDTPNGVGPRKRGTRIPIPYIVGPEDIAWAEQDHPGVDWDAATKRFVDYWRAKTGKDATKLDWPATWRNWIRRTAEGWK